MENPITQLARASKFHREALRALAPELPEDDEVLDRVLAETVEARDESAFTHILLAALDAGRPISARHLVGGASLLPELGHLASAALHCSGDVAEALLAAVADGSMGWEREATALYLAAIWCEEHRDGVVPRELIVSARTLARQMRDGLPRIPLLALAEIVCDKSLTSVLGLGEPLGTRTLVRDFKRGLIDRSKESVLSHVPETPEPVVLSGYTVRRAVARVGRNQPCPCGSGKKYKRCCFARDQERLQHSSAVPGITVDELRENPEPFMTHEQLLDMRSYEVARLDPTRITEELHPLLVDRLLTFKEHEKAVRALEQFGLREDLEDAWYEAVRATTRHGLKDLIVRLIKLRGGVEALGKDLNLGTRLVLAAEDEGERLLDIVEAEARKVLERDHHVPVVDMAYSLLESRFPALGILVARSAIPICDGLDAMTLFDALLEARDTLDLSPDDPFDAILDQRFLEETRPDEVESEALTEARARLATKSREVSGLRGELRDLHRKLQQKTGGPEQRSRTVHDAPAEERGDVPVEPVEERSVSDLRERVAALKSELKQRHSERNGLRRELQKMNEDLECLRKKTSISTSPRPVDAAEEEDQLLGLEEPLGSQPVRLPVYSKSFRGALESLPQPVARAALALTGKLAAGDSAAFQGVRRLKLAREILRQRVGAGHRLLFRLEKSTVEVLELINRRDLERTIKALAKG